MKKTVMLGLVLGAGVLGLGLAAREDENSSNTGANPGTTSTTSTSPKGDAPQGAPAKGPRIAVEPELFDFGKSLQHKTLTKEFSIRNFGSEDLVIENVSTTCGCTAAVAGETTVKPGASTPLKVSLETRGNVGQVERTVLVRSNDPQKTVLELRVRTQVEEPPAAPATK
jgi:hypothetical protein